MKNKNTLPAVIIPDPSAEGWQYLFILLQGGLFESGALTDLAAGRGCIEKAIPGVVPLVWILNEGTQCARCWVSGAH